MDEGTERTGLFAKGGVGRFLLALTVGAFLFFVAMCGVFTVVTAIGTFGYLGSRRDEMDAAKEEGAAFAVGRTITECVHEAQQRGAALCPGSPTCSVTVGKFLSGCAMEATDDGYCATIPPLSDIGAAIEWSRAECAETPGVWCKHVVDDVVAACRIRAWQQTSADDAPPADDARAE